MVTCSEPSSRLTTPTSAFLTPATKIRPPGATVTGGHVTAQSPLQLDFDGFAVSLSKRYKVRSAPLTTTGFNAPALLALSCTHFWAMSLAAVFGVPSEPLAQSPVFA